MQRTTVLPIVWKKIPISVLGIILVFAVLLGLLWYNVTNSYQSLPAIFPDIYFEGQYKIGDGRWQTVVEGQHIPAGQGDVTLKGQFHMTFPGGEYLGVAEPGVSLAFYANHIRITVLEEGQEPYFCDIENEFAGEGMCGELCTGYTIVTEEPITLIFHNNHRFGNENAIDDFLRELAIYPDASYEKSILAQGNTERNVGLGIAILAFVVLGTALFSALLQVEGGSKLWLIGLCVFFAGGYLVYGARGVFFWSESVIGNTTVLGACVMLYMLSACTLITSMLKGIPRKISMAANGVLAAGIGAIGLLCLFTDVYFYDTWLWWAILQSVVNLTLFVCLSCSLKEVSKEIRFCSICAMFLLVGFEIDFVATLLGWWQGGIVSKYIFMALLAISMILVWQIIPKNINAGRKAKEMEAEQNEIRAQLQEKRIAIMISQIQPHFIYNTLGTIQYLCKEDPEKASQLVQNFSLYLRGNFSELDNTVPIRFSKELEHVRCYTEIELIRFPDMTVNYDIRAKGFLLPALTVQPMVENAIKHGLMGREEGGTVTVTSYETDSHYCVCVADDGVGFDVDAAQDPRKHIGIRNVRERLQVMCGGSLTIESEPGKGTTALIQIPKEGKKV